MSALVMSKLNNLTAKSPTKRKLFSRNWSSNKKNNSRDDFDSIFTLIKVQCIEGEVGTLALSGPFEVTGSPRIQ